MGTVWSELRSNSRNGDMGDRQTVLRSGGGLECQAKGDRGKSGVQYNSSRRIGWLSEKGELVRFEKI